MLADGKRSSDSRHDPNELT